ncbi:hypothetical protein PTI45_04649 [Paenibacillus nuruki]|uniref:Uncharacterized protein n=1 Tax=Paenibacillus nuruki TaxID=1886670 RepID=A0A1E3KX94_9BACL|nr:hypothetical protein PTI45_04649 [Paenibacillus nuruki]
MPYSIHLLGCTLRDRCEATAMNVLQLGGSSTKALTVVVIGWSNRTGGRVVNVNRRSLPGYGH